MSREALAFKPVFDAMCMAAGGYAAADVSGNAALQTQLLAIFNRTYRKGYGRYLWEDAWEGATLTPAGRTLTYTALDDARRFEVWTLDPRAPENAARPVRHVTSSSGVELLTDETSVYVLSMRREPKFTTAAWVTATAYTAGTLVLFTDGQVYECLTGHTSGTFSTDLAALRWRVVPVLAVLEDFMIEYGRGTFLLEQGQTATGAELRRQALDDLERLAQNEHFRTASAAWRPGEQA